MIKSLVYLAILTACAAAAWIFFSVYHSSVDSTIAEDTAIQIVPLVPSFDISTVEELTRRNRIVPNLGEQLVVPLPSTEAPISTGGASIAPVIFTPSQTPVGQ